MTAGSAGEWRTDADTICRDGGTVLFASLSAVLPNGVLAPAAKKARKLGVEVCSTSW